MPDDKFVAHNLAMDHFETLRKELEGVDNISALARHTGLSRDHLQRIRDGKVSNTTIKTMQTIRDGIAALRSGQEAA